MVFYWLLFYFLMHDPVPPGYIVTDITSGIPFANLAGQGGFVVNGDGWHVLYRRFPVLGWHGKNRAT
jgi:hypothetical protein